MERKYWILIFTSFIAVIFMGLLTINVVQSNTVTKQLSVAKYQLDQGQYQLCVEAYHDVLDIDPSQVTAHVGIAKCYAALGDIESAERALLAAIELLPNEEILYLSLADIYIEHFFIDRAIHIVEAGMNTIGSVALIDKLTYIDERLHIDLERPLIQKGFTRDIEFGWLAEDEELFLLDAAWDIDTHDVGAIQVSENKLAVFTANEVGTATIVVTFGSLVKELEIEVKEQVLQHVTIELEHELPLAVGEQVTLSAYGYDYANEQMSFVPSWQVTNNLGSLTNRTENAIDFIAEKEGTEVVTVSFDGIVSELTVPINGDLFHILYEASGSGTVTVTPGQDGYSYGTDVTIQAIASDGWEFVRWDGEHSGQSNPFTLNVSEDILIRAIFEQKQHSLNVSIVGEGEIIRSSLASSFSHMEVVTFTARPKDGWEFVGWEGDSTATTPRLTVTMDRSKTITATFVKKNEAPVSTTPTSPTTPIAEAKTFTLTTRVTGEGQVTRDVMKERYEEGANVKLTAIAAEGWEFARWEGAATGNSSNVTVKVDANKTVRAVFTKVEQQPTMYELTSSITGEGTITRSSNANSFVEGSEVTLTAEAKEGWVFSHWDADVSSTNPTLTFTITKHTHVRAVFVQYVEE